MDQPKDDLDHDAARGASQRGLSIEQFCERYGVGRTKAYAEIKSGRLRARKVGRRTILIQDDAEEWLRKLPPVGGER